MEQVEAPARPAPFGLFVNRANAAGRLVVQPRMGMSDPDEMRAGLRATRLAGATTVGTLTVDSYTRLGDLGAARRAMASGRELNGYPIACHRPAVTRGLLEAEAGPRFPVQVRHGSPDPRTIARALLAAGLDATEGGPVSYCLPYSRMPVRQSVEYWAETCRLLARNDGSHALAHLESFGGCLLGQLCPPSLLIAVSVLEALFFRQHGIRSVSLSYAQQACAEQDLEAIDALRELSDGLLADLDRHIVLYAYMGVFPSTVHGATRLLEDAARLAVRSGAARLIVKTTAEAHRIPTVAENVTALETAAAAAERAAGQPQPARARGTGLLDEASALIERVLGLSRDVGAALAEAVERGILDIPYCLHPDNAGRARGYFDEEGRLQWAATGAMPIARGPAAGGDDRVSSAGLLDALHYVARRYDEGAASRTPAPLPALRHESRRGSRTRQISQVSTVVR